MVSVLGMENGKKGMEIAPRLGDTPRVQRGRGGCHGRPAVLRWPRVMALKATRKEKLMATTDESTSGKAENVIRLDFVKIGEETCSVWIDHGPEARAHMEAILKECNRTSPVKYRAVGPLITARMRAD